MNISYPSGHSIITDRASCRDRSGGVTLLLGPTNTGKTHYALERMLCYSSGMIGLPLRLLAREIDRWLDCLEYDRLAASMAAGCGERRSRRTFGQAIVRTFDQTARSSLSARGQSVSPNRRGRRRFGRNGLCKARGGFEPCAALHGLRVQGANACPRHQPWPSSSAREKILSPAERSHRHGGSGLGEREALSR